MTLNGYQFDKAKVTPEADAQLYSYLAQTSDNKVISDLTATATGLNVYVSAGKALVQGRLIENSQQMQLTAQANNTGYVCVTIDLTQTNTSTGSPGTSNYVPVNNQLRLELVGVLNQQDLNSGGLIYTFPIYSYTSTGTSVALTKIDKSFRDLYTTNIGIGYGVTANLVRSGSTVTVYVGSNQTIPISDGYSNLTETLPIGYRPIFNSWITFDITIGSLVQWDRMRRQRILSDGSMVAFAKNMNVAPLTVNGNITYQTDDPYPI